MRKPKYQFNENRDIKYGSEKRPLGLPQLNNKNHSLWQVYN